MKYVLFFESTDAVEALKREKKLQEISKKVKEEDKKMKALTPVYTYADLSGGLEIIETDDIEEIVGLVSYFSGAVNYKVIPIIEKDRLVEIADDVAKEVAKLS
ncbi:MAG: DUF3303 family protein [Promethearchaeota archaeon]